MKVIPQFEIMFGDFLSDVFDAVASFLGAVLAAIGELFVSACEAVFGTDSLVVVLPSGLAGAVVLGCGIRLMTGGGVAALLSVATLIIISSLFLFVVLATLLASARRRRRQ